MEQYLQVKILPVSASESEILIAELSDHGFYAFVEEAGALLAYIVPKDFSADFLKDLLPAGKKFEITVIENKDWNEQWEADFKPVIIDNLVGIRAGFHEKLPGVKYEIVITPKMSFGTGHHATTALMIRLMNKIDFTGKSVIDFGTGTGVLAILAEMMGAKTVMAIDNDDWSIRNATENIVANNCHNITITAGQNPDMCTPSDIVLANINRNILLENATSLSTKIKQNGYLLLSGILVKDDQMIVTAYEGLGFNFLLSLEENGWMAMMFQK